MYKLLLCLRYLRTRYIALASVISVMLGVATMIVVNSVMAGFTSEMRDRIHGFLADIVVESRSSDGLEDSRMLLERVQHAAGSYIDVMTPTVEVPGMISFEDPYGETYTSQVLIVGIDPAGKGQVGPLRPYLDSYHPVVENGQVIREALRSEEEPLSWELTAEAAEYRRLMKELDRRYAQQNQLGRFQPDEGPQVSSPVDTAQLPDPVFDDPAESPAHETTERNSEDNIAGRIPAVDDPIASMPEEFQDELIGGPPEDAFSPEPLAARVYLGDGIVSFRTTNRETGEPQKVTLVHPGDDIRLTTVTVGRPEAVSFRATVTDLFRSGMSEYDGQLVLMNLEQLQQNRNMIVDGVDAITSIQIKLKNYDDADAVIERLTAAFPPAAVSIRTWESKQGLLLSAVDMEITILNVLLFLIITVAGFGILAIFFMIVVEKTRDIGILKSLGASSRGVMSIFLSYGLALGIVGSVAGMCIGLVFVRYINQIEDALSWLTGRRVFDEEIYYFSSIPTHVSPFMVFWVVAGAIGIAVLASVLPARRASRLHPVRALRFD